MSVETASAAERPFALFSQRGCLTIRRIDICDLLVELGIGLRREPVTDQVRAIGQPSASRIAAICAGVLPQHAPM